jgi:UDPglucose--hexose-1-phosphate uridylyltransferase
VPELRKDPVTGRWVIISTERQKRPNSFQIQHALPLGLENCPFCSGREDLTPPEVLAYRQNGSAANTPGWDLRVVPNKFPALKVEGGLEREGEGMFDRMNGVGAHEVIVETPEHAKTLATMSEGEIERVLYAFRDRIQDLKRDRRFRYILQESRRRRRGDARAHALAAHRVADRARFRSRGD